MILKAIIDKLEDVEEAFRGAYVQKGDKWELQVEGMKTPGDVTRLQGALDKEKRDHAAVKTELATAKTSLEAFGDLNADEVHTKLAEYDTLKASAGATPDAQRIAQMVNDQVQAKLKIETGPLTRKLQAAERERDALKASNDEVTGKYHGKVIEDNLRAEAVKAKATPEMIDDLVALSRGAFKLGEGDKPITEDGMDPAAFIAEQKSKRPHFWPSAQGAGGRGGAGGNGVAQNPFTNEHWDVTKQSVLYRENATEATRQAELAGTKIGGGRPPVKTA